MKNISSHPISHPQFNQKTSCFPDTMNCLDLGSIFLLSDTSISLSDKADIVQHVYKCASCNKTFLEYLELDGSIGQFCKHLDDFRKKNNLYQTPFINSASVAKCRIFFSSSLILPALITLLLFVLVLPSFRSPYQSITRDSASMFFADVYPRPNSTIDLNSLYFAWRSPTDYLYSKISIYDSELLLLYENDIYGKNSILLTPDLRKLFYANTQFFWSIKLFLKSGNSVESLLYPFKVIK
jgi:hypothetical protein